MRCSSRKHICDIWSQLFGLSIVCEVLENATRLENLLTNFVSVVMEFGKILEHVDYEFGEL